VDLDSQHGMTIENAKLIKDPFHERNGEKAPDPEIASFRPPEADLTTMTVEI